MEIKNNFRKHRNKFSAIGNSILKYIEISVVCSILLNALAYSDNNWVLEKIVTLILSIMFVCIVSVDIDKFIEENNIDNIFYQITITIFMYVILFLFVDFISGIITEFDIFH